MLEVLVMIIIKKDLFMDWKDYEKEIHNYFNKKYSNLKITYNAKVVGKYSKKPRQIDVLIEGLIADFPIRIVVDAKFFSKKIDVKCVESFISMLEDVDAQQGMLITQKGYSQAAINRAHYGPNNLELDVLNFDDLLDGQGLKAIPYSGESAILLSSPFGWIVDNSKRDNTVATLYQRGISFEEASKRHEWIYCNFYKKDENIKSISDLLLKQNSRMNHIYKNLVIDEQQSPVRADGLEVHIRVAKFDELKGEYETTGFIDIGEDIVFFVLFSPSELQKRNIKKLIDVVENAEPIKVSFDNDSAIRSLESDIFLMNSYQLKNAYAQLSTWCAESKYYEKELYYRRLLWGVDSQYYENIMPLIVGELRMGFFDSAIMYSINFFSSNKYNPRAMQDLLMIFDESDLWVYFEEIVKALIVKFQFDNEASGNINIHYAMFLYNSGRETESIANFKLAEAFFKKVDVNHYVLAEISEILSS